MLNAVANDPAEVCSTSFDGAFFCIIASDNEDARFWTNLHAIRSNLPKAFKMAETFPETAIVVYEAKPYWGPELQRQFQGTGVAVRECRSVRDLIPAIVELERALLIIDLTAGLAECLEWLAAEFAQDPREIPLIALGSAETHELEWILRESGVAVYLPELTGGEALARICRRQLDLRGPLPFTTTKPHRFQGDAR